MNAATILTKAPCPSPLLPRLFGRIAYGHDMNGMEEKHVETDDGICLGNVRCGIDADCDYIYNGSP